MSVKTAACATVLPFDGSFNYPRDTKSLASCTTTSSVLCKTLKELFFFMLISSGLFLKADAKVRLFSELPKLFEENFQFLAKKIRDLTNIKPRNGVTPYYIYKGLLVFTRDYLLSSGA